MMVYCRDRSMKLPRKPGRFIKRKPPKATGKNRLPEPFRPVINNLPSVLERRCDSGQWKSAEEDSDWYRMLEEWANG